MISLSNESITNDASINETFTPSVNTYIDAHDATVSIFLSNESSTNNDASDASDAITVDDMW
jgi:hypothetical protein